MIKNTAMAFSGGDVDVIEYPKENKFVIQFVGVLGIPPNIQRRVIKLKYTSNYNLKKPEGTDTVNIDDLNNNADILDTKINSINEQIDTLTIQDDSFREQINNLGEDVNELFQSVSDGKTLVARAITDKGVNTSPTDTFRTMADNIEDIEIDPSIGTTDAVATDVLSGKKVVSQGNLLTGTMPNRVAVNQNLTTEGQEYTIPSGYHNGLGKVKAVIIGLVASVIKAGTTVGGILGTFTSDATAVDADVLSGKSYYRNSVKGTGSMVDRGAVNQTLTTQGQQYTIPAGKHSGSGKVTANFANLTAVNVKDGVNIGGIVGTFKQTTNIPSVVIDANSYIIAQDTLTRQTRKGYGQQADTYGRWNMHLTGTIELGVSLMGNGTDKGATLRVLKNGNYVTELYTTSETYTMLYHNITVTNGDIIRLELYTENTSYAAYVNTVQFRGTSSISNLIGNTVTTRGWDYS